MNATLRARSRTTLPLFGLLTTLVLGVARYAVTRPGAPPAVAVGVAIDLTVTLPVLYYILVVRRLRWPRASVLAIVAAGAAVSGLVFSNSAFTAPGFVPWIAALAELALFVLLVRAAGRARRRFRDSGQNDRVLRLREAAATVLGDGRAADILAYEASVLAYAFLSWRHLPPDEAPGVDRFTVHRRSGYAGIVIALIIAVLAEIVPVHALVSPHSEPVAWILTIISLYGGVWLVADLRAAKLRSVAVRPATIDVFLGLRWWGTVPVRSVRSSARIGSSTPKPTDGIRVSLPGAPLVRLELDEAAILRGPYGIRRSVRILEIGIDEPDSFLAALERARSAA